MDNQEKVSREYYTIDVLHIIRTLAKRLWLIVVVGVVFGLIGFMLSAFVISPTYSSSIMLYVNNGSFSLGNTSFSISSSEITAAQSLVKTYSEILNNRTTLERVIEKADVDYTYKELSEMISAEPKNDTQIMLVTVETDDPYEASSIANCIAEVLPVRISEIIDGATMEVVDSAIPDFEKVAPGVAKYTAVGMIIGVILISGIVVVFALMDGTIQDEEYVIRTYDYPVLAKIPGLLNSGSKQSGYYQYKQTERK